MNSFADNVKFLPSNQEAHQVRMDLISQAQHEILAEYFSFTNDDESVRGLAFLLSAAQRGVQVRIVMDAIANSIPPELFAAL